MTCLFRDNADPLVPEATPCQYPSVLRLPIFSLHKHNPTVSPERGSWSHAGLDNRENLRGREPETAAHTHHKAGAGAQHLPDVTVLSLYPYSHHNPSRRIHFYTHTANESWGLNG